MAAVRLVEGPRGKDPKLVRVACGATGITSKARAQTRLDRRKDYFTLLPAPTWASSNRRVSLRDHRFCKTYTLARGDLLDSRLGGVIWLIS
jgi:hypothetical protein